MLNNNQNKLQKYVTFCSPDFEQSGRDAENATIQYLLDNLSESKVGKYQLLMNYNIPQDGNAGVLEIDIVAITRFGIFLIEVKDWRGLVEAYNGSWVQNHKYERGDVIALLNHKCRVLKSNLFGHFGALRDLHNVSVTGMVILYKGVNNFINRSNNPNIDAVVVELEPPFIQNLSSRQIAHYGQNSSLLADEEIQRIKDALFSTHRENENRVIRNYRILGELSPGALFESYDAVNNEMEQLRVRLKKYQLTNFSLEGKELNLFKRNALAVRKLGNHPNIFQTYDFFQDSSNPNIFYEVTEPVDGQRLDEIVTGMDKPLTLKEQLDYIEPLCEALKFAHAEGVYHRNINPETVFITSRNIVKLADFDFAKLMGNATISMPGKTLVDNPYTAPELGFNSSAASPASDIYSLGALWFALAKIPEKDFEIRFDDVDQLNLPEVASRLMKTMLTQQVQSRPQSIDKILQKVKILRR